MAAHPNHVCSSLVVSTIPLAPNYPFYVRNMTWCTLLERVVAISVTHRIWNILTKNSKIIRFSTRIPGWNRKTTLICIVLFIWNDNYDNMILICHDNPRVRLGHWPCSHKIRQWWRCIKILFIEPWSSIFRMKAIFYEVVWFNIKLMYYNEIWPLFRIFPTKSPNFVTYGILLWCPIGVTRWYCVLKSCMLFSTGT